MSGEDLSFNYESGKKITKEIYDNYIKDSEYVENTKNWLKTALDDAVQWERLASVRDYVVATQQHIRNQAKHVANCVENAEGVTGQCARYMRDAVVRNMRDMDNLQCSNNLPGNRPEDIKEYNKKEKRKLKKDIQRLKKRQQDVQKEIDAKAGDGAQCSLRTNKQMEKELKDLRKTSDKIEKRIKKKMRHYKRPTRHMETSPDGTSPDGTSPDETSPKKNIFSRILTCFCTKKNKEDNEDEVIYEKKEYKKRKSNIENEQDMESEEEVENEEYIENEDSDDNEENEGNERSTRNHSGRKHRHQNKTKHKKKHARKHEN